MHVRFSPTLWLQVCLLFVLLAAGCATRESVPLQPQDPPLYLVDPLHEATAEVVDEATALKLALAMSPASQGLASWNDMKFAVSQSLAHARQKPARQLAVNLHGVTITYGDMADALERLLVLLPELDENPAKLAQTFTWLRIGPDFGFTGYYEPTIQASFVRTAKFKHPLYAVPRAADRTKSRHQIDCKQGLSGKGLELAWIEDPIDSFILQIQGSGRLVFEDGTERAILYAGQNGHKYKAIGRLMKEKGYLAEYDLNMKSIRAWLKANPRRQEEVMDYNQSYVFFRLGPAGYEGSLGSMGRKLTPRVSAAVDQTVLPNGLLTFMSVPLPDDIGHPRRPFHALMLPQDSGGAIKRNRVDLFFGNGDEAEHMASHVNIKGAVFVLMPRQPVQTARR